MGNFHEPWRAERPARASDSFDMPEDWTQDQRDLWNQFTGRADKPRAQIWGSGVFAPGEAQGLVSGDLVDTVTDGVLIDVEPVVTSGGRLDPMEYAARVAACVNYCEGVETGRLERSGLRGLLAWQEIEFSGATRQAVNELWRPKWPPEEEQEEPMPEKKGRRSA